MNEGLLKVVLQKHVHSATSTYLPLFTDSMVPVVSHLQDGEHLEAVGEEEADDEAHSHYIGGRAVLQVRQDHTAKVEKKTQGTYCQTEL